MAKGELTCDTPIYIVDEKLAGTKVKLLWHLDWDGKCRPYDYGVYTGYMNIEMYFESDLPLYQRAARHTRTPETDPDDPNNVNAYDFGKILLHADLRRNEDGTPYVNPNYPDVPYFQEPKFTGWIRWTVEQTRNGKPTKWDGTLYDNGDHFSEFSNRKASTFAYTGGFPTDDIGGMANYYIADRPRLYPRQNLTGSGGTQTWFVAMAFGWWGDLWADWTTYRGFVNSTMEMFE